MSHCEQRCDDSLWLMLDVVDWPMRKWFIDLFRSIDCAGKLAPWGKSRGFDHNGLKEVFLCSDIYPANRLLSKNKLVWQTDIHATFIVIVLRENSSMIQRLNRQNLPGRVEKEIEWVIGLPSVSFITIIPSNPTKNNTGKESSDRVRAREKNKKRYWLDKRRKAKIRNQSPFRCSKTGMKKW